MNQAISNWKENTEDKQKNPTKVVCWYVVFSEEKK